MRARLYGAGGELLAEVELRERANGKTLGPAEAITLVLDEPTRADPRHRLFLSGRLERLP